MEAPSSLVSRVAARIKAKFSDESSGHDWHHIHRVWQLARQIGEAEGADLDVVQLAALVHDIADWKFHGGDDSVGPREARRLLAEEGTSARVIDQVVEIVSTISYKGACVATPMRSLEGKCVQDADRLDAIGAIGIARCFAYGGHAGRLMYDPDVPPVMHATAEQYKAAKSHSLNHFYEKLFFLKDRMNTATGKSLAEQRHQFMEDFVEQFLTEWNVGAGGDGLGREKTLNVSYLPTFSAPAKKLWERIPKDTQARLVSNVWCGACHAETTITNFNGTCIGGNLLLEGQCKQCGGNVARYLES